ncbi:MAG: 30S ribosomal protein S6e [Desulfurococcaceae archaeon]|jgi:small subunit ribosomal protein S6e|nr:30S ribosomal protein S6e [Desulfurococcaceae archaeon]
MPEFKVVVSDPEAVNPRPLLVKVVGSSDLSYGEEHKNNRVLTICKINPETRKAVNSPLGIATLRIWKNKANKEKVNLTVKLVDDPSVPPDTVVVPSAFLSEKVGSEEVLGEIFRAVSFQVSVTGDKANALVGKKIGDTVPASIVGLPAEWKLLITGGSDSSGFPMIPSLQGGVKKALLLSEPPGFHPRDEGERRRKYVRGNTVTDEIVQINTKLIR